MNRIIENANAYDAKLETLGEADREDFDTKLSLDSAEIVGFKDAIALGQVEGRITLAEAETLQHAITLVGWRKGLSLGMRAAVYLACAELIGIDVNAATQRASREHDD